MADIVATVRGWGVGWLIALVVLVLCVVLWFVGRALSPGEVLGLIGALALARLL